MDGFNSTAHEINENITGYISTFDLVTNVIGWVTLCIELLILCWAIFALYHQVKANHVAPVYLINLLISDMFQLIGRAGSLVTVFNLSTAVLSCIFLFGVIASVWFMVCIALERYLVVVHPLWYRFHRTIKQSILISLAVWVSPLLLFVLSEMLFLFLPLILIFFLLCFIIFVLPIPLLVFFLVSTWRSLSRSISVPVKEKKRILCTLILVLGNYIVLFIPGVISCLILSVSNMYSPLLYIFVIIGLMLWYFSPLMDCFLYIFLRNEASTTPKLPACCWKLMGRQEHSETSTVQTVNVTHV